MISKVSIYQMVAEMICSATLGRAATKPAQKEKQPNFIIILCDDMGYGDLSCYGNPVIKTPNIDRMACEGQKWTNFYSAAAVSTPSRAGLITGRYPIRSGMIGHKRGVLFPDSEGGLPDNETTIAELLKQQGYITGTIGKWHLGNIPEYSPLKNGFDYSYSLPYSNDMQLAEGYDYYKTAMNPVPGVFNVPLYQNDSLIEQPVDQNTLTKRYTEHAVTFIEEHKDQHFFLYLAQSMPHVPLHRSEKFNDISMGGIYGDVIEEIDWSVGEILNTLKSLDLDENTLVVLTSDNGPWAWFKTHGGSAGPLRGSKDYSYEGGNRVPAIFWMPGTVSPGIITGMGASLDFLPTFCHLSGTKIPSDILIDGVDISNTLENEESSQRESMFYYKRSKLVACRYKYYKYHFFDPYDVEKPVSELYNIATDISEKYNIADDHPEIVEQIMKLVDAHQKSIIPVTDQLK